MWDTAVVLAYAAEQLFMASQALTSDTVPRQDAVRFAYEDNLSRLIEHDRHLPEELRAQLRDALATYYEEARNGPLTSPRAQVLSDRIMELFEEVRAELLRIEAEATPADFSLHGLVA